MKAYSIFFPKVLFQMNGNQK